MKKIDIDGQNNRYLIKKVNKEPKKNLNKNILENNNMIDNHVYQKELLNIIYLNHTINESENDNKMNEIKTIKKNILNKTKSYIHQDEKKNRININTPLLIDDVYELLLEDKMLCHYCNCKVFIYYEKYRDQQQWTLERKNNELPHFKDNCVISCLKCNLQRRCKNMDNFKFTKNLIIKKI